MKRVWSVRVEETLVNAMIELAELEHQTVADLVDMALRLFLTTRTGAFTVWLRGGYTPNQLRHILEQVDAGAEEVTFVDIEAKGEAAGEADDS